ncbi:sensor histidine kinase [Paenibacillus sp. CF384]|uniref:cache domain-containing sensor histidine kinase n=1 Tax=Paenibacillus sp. CF384 TaxID=1884382 RepID=UPI000895D7DD|nr:sensor histidine kinase [Paenibacillus sp. CF384]SDW14818.1 two-component system, sensor histidine kinase YesM [Paenibacillus sp. CF384]
MKPTARKAVQWFNNLSISYKLFASYLLVICIPFLLLLLIHLNITQRENKEQMLYSAHKMLDETKSYLEYKAQAVTEVLNFIAFNELVQTSVASDAAQYEDVNLWGTDANKLAKVLNQFRNNEDIDTIQLYMKQGLASAADNSDYLRMGSIESTEWFKTFTASNYAYAWLPSAALDGTASEERISVLRKIPNYHNIQQFDGMVRAQMKQSALQSVLEHAVITPSTSAVLLNRRGDILSATSKFAYNQDQLRDILLLHPPKVDKDNYWNDNLVFLGTRLSFGIQEIPHTDMRIAMIVPYSDILKSTTKARNRLISIFLIVIPLTLPLSFFVASSATKRLRRLIVHVRKVKNGHFQLAPLPTNEDEIGELTRNFNVMVQNTSRLLDETYTLGREVKNKELKALQAQINPHFLYNTLDLINVMAIENGSKEISKVVDELAIFYKLSLSNGRERVTLANEIKHVVSYVHIQNMRFGGCISLILEIPRELNECIVPKIILQPIIENAILHGIMEKEREEGTIRISARAVKGDVLIEVEDDGVGMKPEELEQLFSEQTKQVGGFGVRNIQERLRISYGAAYGVEFESEMNRGTIVRLLLPDQRESSS